MGVAGGQRIEVLEVGQVLSWRQVLARWRDPDFADWFSGVLASAPWPAFFWECAPLTVAHIDQSFAFVLVESRSLDGVVADPVAFSEWFAPGRRAVVFGNLGGDATLVAPCPDAELLGRAHLADFVRHGTVGDQRALWSAVADAVEAALDRRPLWLSTSGLGVSYLHIRLDRRPKYYTYAPYRSAPA